MEQLNINHILERFDKEKEHKFKNRMNNYNAFMTRIKLVEMVKDHENSEKFPYTTDDLAIYMHDYVFRNMNDDIEIDSTLISD